MKNRYWKVRCTIPTRWKPADEREYNANHNLGVKAANIDGAISAIRAMFPRCTIWGVQDCGVIEVDADRPGAPVDILVHGQLPV